MKENYLAIALGKSDVGEADRRYVFYTREGGLLYVKARGIRKSDAKLAAHIEDFMLSHIVIAKNFGPGTLAGASSENSFSTLRSSYETLCMLDRVRKIFVRLLRTEQADQRVFEVFRHFLETVEKCDDRIHVLALGQYFLLKLFDLLGYRFPLGQCRECHETLNQERNYFASDRGGMLCSRCARHISGGVPVDPDTLKLMRLIPHNDLNALAKVKVSDRVTHQLQVIADHTANWIMR